tara:strand:- start:1111 stop:2592 length:1482 start_codon:yes stop_codon:yes gene_type:complete
MASGSMGYQDGGEYRPQGNIPLSMGSGVVDDVPALLTAGEYVIKRSSAEKYGTAFLDRLNAGVVSEDIKKMNKGGRVSRTTKSGARLKRAIGGHVPPTRTSGLSRGKKNRSKNIQYNKGVRRVNRVMDNTAVTGYQNGGEVEQASGTLLYTSLNSEHRHEYFVDQDGNGKAYESCHPESNEICHSHEIINFVVQSAQSSCYPDCESLYGWPGAPPHIHTLKNTYGDGGYNKGGKVMRRKFNKGGKASSMGSRGRVKKANGGRIYGQRTSIGNRARRTTRGITRGLTQANQSNVPSILQAQGFTYFEDFDKNGDGVINTIDAQTLQSENQSGAAVYASMIITGQAPMPPHRGFNEGGRVNKTVRKNFAQGGSTQTPAQTNGRRGYKSGGRVVRKNMGGKVNKSVGVGNSKRSVYENGGMVRTSRSNINSAYTVIPNLGALTNYLNEIQNNNSTISNIQWSCSDGTSGVVSPPTYNRLRSTFDGCKGQISMKSGG